MIPARILIVDDDENVCQTFAAALTHEGYQVRVAATSKAALQQVAREKPDAILLDLNMPFINGMGFLYRLRANSANRNTPVAMITGAVMLDDGTCSELRDLDTEVWFKPIWLDEVLNITRLLLARGKSATPSATTGASRDAEDVTVEGGRSSSQ